MKKENKLRTIVLGRQDFERARHATILNVDARLLRHRMPDSLILLDDDRAMLAREWNRITFRKRFSLEKIERGLQTIIVDNSNRFDRRAHIYLDENI